MPRARVGTKGQAVIPKEVRDRLGIRPGDEVVFTVHGGHAHVEPAKRVDRSGFWDRMPRFGLPDGFNVDEEIERSLAEEWGA